MFNGSVFDLTRSYTMPVIDTYRFPVKPICRRHSVSHHDIALVNSIRKQETIGLMRRMGFGK